MLASSVAERGERVVRSGEKLATSASRALPIGLGSLIALAAAFGLAWHFAIWPLNQTSARALERRAQLFWDLRLSGDTLGAYDHMMDAYRRRVDATSFARGNGGLVQWTTARVVGATLDEKGGLVDIELRYRIRKQGLADQEHASAVRERWVLENGGWYRWPPEMGG